MRGAMLGVFRCRNRTVKNKPLCVNLQTTTTIEYSRSLFFTVSELNLKFQMCFCIEDVFFSGMRGDRSDIAYRSERETNSS